MVQTIEIQKPYRASVTETESKPCLYTAINSVTMGGQNNSSFTIKSGADVQTLAPHISLKPGFKVEEGAHFVAKPQQTVNGLKSYNEQTVQPEPRNTVTYLTPSQYQNKVYDYNDKESLPHTIVKTDYSSKLTIYPNPAANELFIVCNDSSMATFTIRIVSMLGITIKNITVYNNASFDISFLLPGIYIIQVPYNNRQYNFKLIKE